MFSVFASIGLSRLIPAMGMRSNTKEYIPVQKLDELSSGCFSCPYYKAGNGMCEECKTKKYYTETKVKYINERSRFSYSHPLKKNALILYMYIHFLSPDEQGYISKIDPEEMAEKLGCTVRTVVNNLRLLDKTGYIVLGKHTVPGYFQAFICDYKKIYDKADKGGRGYLRIGKDFISALSNLPDTNSIRLAVRSYLKNIEFSRRPQADREQSIKDIKMQLPEYVTKKKLMDMLSGKMFGSLFSVSTKKRSATIITNPEYDQEKVSDLVKQECMGELRKEVDRINKDARGTKKKPGKIPLRLSERDMADIANISLKLPIGSIMEGVRYFYERYIVKNISYSSAGALIRTFASDHATYGFISG